MGYKIVYGPAGPKKRISREIGKKLLLKVVAAALLLGLRFTGIGERISEFLIPGDAAVTAAAWDGMTENIAAGENIGDAITTFCREIIENADIS